MMLGRKLAASMASISLMLAQLAPMPAALAPIGMADVAARQLTQTISCNSRGNQPNTCRLPAGTISVSYLGPDRSGRCVQGRTWQQRGNGLWVTGGCGGNFEIVYDTAHGGGNWGGSGGSGGSGSNSQGFAGELTCRSIDNRQQVCRANTGGRVQLLQQYSSTRCVQNSNWRYDRNTITVRDGCQARFGYGYGNNNSGGGWGGSGGNGSNNQGFAGELTCRSQDNRQQFCRANTQGRAQLLQQYSSARCIEGQSWFASNNGITVRNGCQARFGYGYGNNSGGGWGGNNNQGYAGQIECRSDNNRYRRCPANTRNRATLVRQYSNTQCVEGRNWGWDSGAIWVDNGCQGRFAYGFGNVSGTYEGSTGSSSSNAGGIIAGGLLAAGLIAALAAAGKSDKTSASAQSSRGPASVEADWSLLPAAARAEAEACMNEAARQFGATGGTRVKLKDVDTARQSGSGWMILADVTGTWDDHVQTMRMDCRASGSKVTGFDVQ